MRSLYSPIGFVSLIIGIIIFCPCVKGFAEDIEIDLGGGTTATQKISFTPSTSSTKASSSAFKNAATESSAKDTVPKPSSVSTQVLKALKDSVVNQISLNPGDEGPEVSIIGTNLPSPIISKISTQKLLVKFQKTHLKIPKEIQGDNITINRIRSSSHTGNVAWIVLDLIKLDNWEMNKTPSGFLLTLKSKEKKELSESKEVGKPSSVGNDGATEKKLYSRLIDLSLSSFDKGEKIVFTSDGPSKYTIRKLSQPEKLIIRFNNTKLEVAEKIRKQLPLNSQSQKGGLLSLELRQIGPAFSPISEAVLTLATSTTYQVDRDLNQVVITLRSNPAEEKMVGKKGNLNQLISMDVEAADINAVVKTLASESGFEVDFVSGPLNGVVNEKFKDIPLKTALATLLSPGNYDFEVQGNTLRIGPQANLKASKLIMPHVTEILNPSGGMLPAQFDSLVRNFISPTNAINSVVDPSRNVLILNGTPSDVEDYKRAVKDLKLDEGSNNDRITRIVRLNYADADNIKIVLKPYLSPTGTVQVLQQKLIIWESAANMGVLLELIKELDRKTPQVLIESSIIEIDDEKDLAAGINWSATRNVGDPTINSTFNNPPAASGGFLPGNFAFGTIKNGLNINATISALESHKKGKIISRPRIATASGVAAEIQTTENVVITTITNTLSNGVNQQTITASQLALPIDLKVTPRITDDGRITTIINAQITSQTGPAPSGSNGLPPTSVQTANTTITTKNGETIVIGGLVREVLQDNVNGIPLLSSLPIIGTLFQEHDRTNRKVELVIFITPTLLED